MAATEVLSADAARLLLWESKLAKIMNAIREACEDGMDYVDVGDVECDTRSRLSKLGYTVISIGTDDYRVEW